uniref:Transmembrane protein 107 n=1 Tax=Mesocestoides corti TaxID=53468 RepID=A0A5K3FD11_MESCO
MYAMFMLSGILEMIDFYGIVKLPRNSDYFTCFLSITTEVILFAFHLHGKTLVDVYLHTVLINVIMCIIVAGIFEAIFPTSLLAGLVRSLFLILQGTWFW